MTSAFTAARVGPPARRGRITWTPSAGGRRPAEPSEGGVRPNRGRTGGAGVGTSSTKPSAASDAAKRRASTAGPAGACNAPSKAALRWNAPAQDLGSTRSWPSEAGGVAVTGGGASAISEGRVARLALPRRIEAP